MVDLADRIASKRFQKRVLCVPFFLVSLVTLFVAVIVTSTSFSLGGTNEWAWVGGVQSTRASFRVRGKDGTERTFVVSKSENFLDTNVTMVFSTELSFEGKFDIKEINLIEGELVPATDYFYAIIDGSEVIWTGSFSTPVPEGEKMDFKIAVAGCSLTGSRDNVFLEIAAEEPFMMVHAGDIHYADIGEENIDDRLVAMDRVLGSETASKLYTSTAMAYIWDDHDFCDNNMNSECPGKASARRAYQEVFPHYPLQAPGALPSSPRNRSDVAPYQAFTIGTVRFIITDLRSEAVSGGEMMSEDQFAWLQGEFERAKDFDIVVWVSSKPWIDVPAAPQESSDNWGGWAVDRERISNLIGSTIGVEKRNLIMVSSDAHMVAYDDGRNTDYSSIDNITAGFPLLQSGPLHNIGSVKGGPYSGGCYTYTSVPNHQFSTIEFQTTGPEPCVTISSYRSQISSRSLLLTKTLCGDFFVNVEEELEPELECIRKNMPSETLGLCAFGVGLFIFNSVLAILIYKKDCVSSGSAVSVLFCGTLLPALAGFGAPMLGYFAIRAAEVSPIVTAFAIIFNGLLGLSFLILVFVLRRRRSRVEKLNANL